MVSKASNFQFKFDPQTVKKGSFHNPPFVGPRGVPNKKRYRKGSQKHPWGFFIQIAFVSTLAQPWPGLGPQDSWRLDFERIPVQFWIFVQGFDLFRFVFLSTIICITPLLLLDWLHNCTHVGESTDKDSGEILGAPTWNSPGPPPEAGGTVAGYLSFQFSNYVFHFRKMPYV